MYRSPLHDIDLGAITTQPEADSSQGMFGDFVDSVQRGFFQGMAGDAETVYQLTGKGAGVRNYLSDRSNDQIEQMSEEGQNALAQEIFTEDENGNFTFGEGATNARTWINLFGQGAGTVAAFLSTGFGAGSAIKLGAKAGAKMIGKQVTKEALESQAKKKAAELGFKGRAQAAVANAGIGVAMGNGMVANGEREKFIDMDWNTLNQSRVYQETYWTLRDNPQYEHYSDEEIGNRARAMMAETAAQKAFYSPKLTAANALSGVAGALGGSGLGVTSRVLKPASSAKGGFVRSAFVEGAQEGGQGAVEQYVSNENYRDLIDGNHDVWQGVLSGAVNEAVVGGMMGAPVGAVEGYRNRATPVDDVANSQGQQPTAEPIPQEPQPTPEERAAAQPITGNHALDTEMNRSEDATANFANVLSEEEQTRTQEQIQADLLQGAADRQAGVELEESIEAEPEQPLPQRELLTERRQATRPAAEKLGFLPARNEFQDTIDLAQAYNPERAAEIEAQLRSEDISDEDAQALGDEYEFMAQQARELNLDPLLTSMERTQQRNAQRHAERDNPARKIQRNVERYGLDAANDVASEKNQIRKEVIERLFPEDRNDEAKINRLVEAEYRRRYDDGSLPEKAIYEPEGYQDSGRAFSREDSEQAIQAKAQEAQNASLLAQAEAERNARASEPEANPNWTTELDGEQVTRTYARDVGSLRAHLREQQLDGVRSRIGNGASSGFSQLASEEERIQEGRPTQRRIDELKQQAGDRTYERVFGGKAFKNGMSKSLRRKLQRAKGFDNEAVLNEFRNSEKRLQAYEEEARRQAEQEASSPENIQRRASAEALFTEKMTSPEAKAFAENEITQTLKAVHEQLDSSADTVLEMDGKETTLPKVKQSLEHSVRNLAGKFIGKTAAMEDRLRQKKEEQSEQAEPKAEPEPIKESPELNEQSPDLTLDIDQKKPSQKIEDFGEVLHGAKKHNWGKFGDTIQSAIDKDDYKEKTLAQLLPKPNIKKLHEQGVSKQQLALMCLIRASIPSKGTRKWGRRFEDWKNSVDVARSLYQIVLNSPGNELNPADYTSEAGRVLVEQADNMTLEQIDQLPNLQLGKNPFNGRYNLSVKGVRMNAVEVSSLDALRDRIIPFIEDVLQAKQDKKKAESGSTRTKVNLAVYSNRYDRSIVYIATKIGSRVVKVQSGFTSTNDARAFLNENRETLEGKVIALRKEYKRELRTDENRIRQGDNGRSVDVTPEMFTNEFQFRGVQFGNWVEGKRRQKDLNDAYDSLVDLARLIGVDTQALSLGGELGLAFGARGTGGRQAAAAHYEPGTVVINLTKKNGMGSLAHEWFHALDHYFGRKSPGKSWITESRNVDNPAIREELAQAFIDLKQALDNTGVGKRSKERDKYSKDVYWDKTIEKMARAFESWVIEQNSLHGVTNDYLANVIPESDPLSESYPYPTKAELDNGLSFAFNNLFEKMNSKVDEETGRTILYSKQGMSADKPAKHISKRYAELYIREWKKKQGLDLAEISVLATQKEAEAMVGGEVDAYINAFYTDGKTYVVAENVKDLDDLKRQLRHEVLTHYKLDRFMTDKERYELLNLVHQTQNSEHLRHIWDHVETNYADESPEVKAEEAIAYANEFIDDSKVKAWLDKVLSVIAKMLRRVGLIKEHNLTQAEMNDIARTISSKAAGMGFNVEFSLESTLERDSQSNFFNDPAVAFSRVPKDVKVIKGKPIKGSTIKEKRVFARAKGFELAGQTYVNKESGLKIRVNRAGIKHTVFGAGPELLSSIADLPTILSDSKYLGSKDELKGNPEIKAHHYLGIKYEIGGDVKDVVVDVRETTDGNYYYDHSFEANHSGPDGDGPGPRLRTQGPIAPSMGAEPEDLSASGDNSSGPLPTSPRTRNNTSRVAEAETSSDSDGYDSGTHLLTQGPIAPSEGAESENSSDSGDDGSGPRLHTTEPIYPGMGAESDTSNISQDGEKDNDSDGSVKFSKNTKSKEPNGVDYSKPVVEVNGGRNPSLAIKVKQSKLMQAIKHALTDNKVSESIARNKYALLTLRQLVEVGKLIDKSVGKKVEQYLRVLDEMTARKNDLLESAYQITDEFTAWAKKNQAAADKLFDFMHEATIADVDPSKPFESRKEEIIANITQLQNRLNNLKGMGDSNELRTALIKEKEEWRDMLKREPGRRNDHARLKNRWGTLSKEQKKRFREARDHYDAQTRQMNEALENNIQRTVQDGSVKKEMLLRLRQRQEVAAKGLYFPLARHGDYWINYADESGERQYQVFETKAAMEATKAELEEQGIDMDSLDSGMNMDEGTFNSVSLPFVSDVVSTIRSTKMNDKTKQFLSDEVYQMYLRTLPQRSLRRNHIHRKNVAGFSRDAIRTMADNGYKFARQQSLLEYNDALDGQLQEMMKDAKSVKHGAEVSRLVDELSKRHEWVKNPKRSGIAQRLTGLGFSFLLGLSPAAALINLVQNVQVAIPVLGSVHGFEAASSEMMSASKQFLQNIRKETKGKGHLYASLTREEREAMDRAIKAGAIDVSQTHDLLGLAENPNATYSETQHKIASAVGFMFHKAEVFNREVTLMASYRLNMKKLGDHDAAVEQAIKDVMDSHFDYGSHNRARFMQGDLAAVALQFKQYSQQMTYYLASNFYKMFKGESPEVKAMARKQLAGTLISTFAIGGMGALPIQALVMPLQLAAMAVGDDDEPFDIEVEMKRTLTDWVGEDAAKHLWYGTVPSISNRISLNGLWFHELRESEPDKRYMEVLKQVAGPVIGGVLFNSAQGLGDMMEGHNWRGLEKMMPVAVKNLSKTARYAREEGVLTKNADVVVPWDEIDLVELGGQALGFTLADASIQYDKNSAAYEYAGQATQRRQQLMNAYWSAYRLNDSETIKQVQKQISKFNNSEWGRANPITQKSIKQSMNARKRNQRRSIEGARINPKYHRLVEEYSFF